jgi:ribosome-associated heat shock protein Hsp15
MEKQKVTEKLRLDKYLWAIRVFKTRSQASEAITKGNVKSNGVDVKASKAVSLGDQYEIKTEARKWVVQVSGLLDQRKQYSEAINYYVDLTPEEDPETKNQSVFYDFTGKRKSKQGRPTKRNRRNLDDANNDNIPEDSFPD